MLDFCRLALFIVSPDSIHFFVQLGTSVLWLLETLYMSLVNLIPMGGVMSIMRRILSLSTQISWYLELGYHQ